MQVVNFANECSGLSGLVQVVVVKRALFMLDFADLNFMITFTSKE
jgi:hypothetical protein